MGLFSLPSPVDMFESVATGKLEREVVNSVMSAMYSAWISGMWGEGSSKWAIWSGTGQGMKDAATSAYLSLRELEAKNFLTLTVPKDLLDGDNLKRFQTEQQEKK